MNTVDVLILAALFLSTILGMYWGLIRQVLSVIGLVAGVLVASRYSGGVAETLSSFISNPQAAQVIAFIGIMIIVSALASFLATVLHQAIGLLFLGWLDHLAGGVIGFVQGVLFCTIIVGAAATLPNEGINAALADSQVAMTMVRVFGVVLALVPESFREAAQALLQRP